MGDTGGEVGTGDMGAPGEAGGVGDVVITDTALHLEGVGMVGLGEMVGTEEMGEMGDLVVVGGTEDEREGEGNVSSNQVTHACWC